ncbi:hypothetical protein M9434_002427 [Picochlorum sp. BPE23]|nr:hypothetical protein M9434_002427 [Picochlorum sp. BPE23]
MASITHIPLRRLYISNQSINSQGAHRSVIAKANASRRDGLMLVTGVLINQVSQAAFGSDDLPKSSQIEGSCNGPDCIGEINETLNTCSMNLDSCVSTLNDDESHFIAPWEFESDRSEAIEKLIDVATGGAYDPSFIDSPFGVQQTDAAAYIAKGVIAVLRNGEMPEKPKRKLQDAVVPFKGELIDRHTTQGGSEYVRITLYPSEGENESSQDVDPIEIIDAEFLFLKGDSIVNVRAVSRGQPESEGFDRGQISFSTTSGFLVDKNVARRRMEGLRRALRWQLAPVLTDFDPKFNPEVPEIVERIFQPFSEKNNFKPSGEPYPVE